MNFIFGRINKNEFVNRNLFHRVSDLLEIPGPDLFFDRQAGLAMARKVIDPEAQSGKIIHCAGSDVHVMINGEIANVDGLKREAVKHGFDPGGRDGELVAFLYLAGSAAFVSRLKGAFRIVIWDGRREELVMLVDKVAGLGSLYYFCDSSKFVFGTNIKSIIAHTDVDRRVNSDALSEFFSFGFTLPPNTMFEGVRILEGGSWLTYRKGELKTGKYFKRQFQARRFGHIEEAEEEYFRLLTRAVRRAADGNRPFGIALSGGIDRLIGRTADQAGYRPIRTFSVHFGSDDQKNERIAVRRIVDCFKTDHHEVVCRDDSFLENLADMIWFYEMPVGAVHGNFLLGRALRQEVDLALFGSGNDTIRGRYQGCDSFDPRQLWLSDYLERRYLARIVILKPWARKHIPLGFKIELADLRSRLSRFKVKTGSFYHDILAIQDVLYGAQFSDREVGTMVAEAGALEVKLPFGDEDLSAFVDSLPVEWKIRRRLFGENVLKYLFKRVLEKKKVLPPDVVYRPKRWLWSPVDEWFRGPSGEGLLRFALEKPAPGRGFFNREAVVEMVRRHRSGREDFSMNLLHLASFELWARIFIDSSGLEKPKLKLHEICDYV